MERLFLLTPLREGRLGGGGNYQLQAKFLLTPLREGRLVLSEMKEDTQYFYSRPCGRGDITVIVIPYIKSKFLLTPLREGRQQFSTSPS